MPNPFLLPGMTDPSWQQPQQPQQAAPAPAPAPANPYAPQQGLLQQILQMQQQQQQQIPGMVGAEQGALSELMKLYQQPRQGPDPALLQLAAGFLSPTRTGGFGESLGYAASGYGGALQKQQEAQFDKAAKLAQLKLTQAQLANKIPQMQMEGLTGQLSTVGKMAELEKMGRDAERSSKADQMWQQALKSDTFSKLPEAQRTALMLEPDAGKRAEMLAKFAKGKDLSQKAISELGEQGGAYSTFDSLEKQWNDSFGGYKIPGVGDAVNWAGARGFTGADKEAQANWWSDYQTQKNLIRNKLFGSALTATEKGEFDKANISPDMKPEAIRRNLIRQKEAARAAAAKLARGHASQGYSKEAIEESLGLKLDELGDGKMRDLEQLYNEAGIGTGAPAGGAPGAAGPVQIKTADDYAKLPSGTSYIDPNGVRRTKP